MARHASRSLRVCGPILIGAAALACSATMPPNVGTGRLAPCPETPNCVSSLVSPDADAYVAPFTIVGPAQVAWAEAQTLLEDWPRAEIVRISDGALHAEFTSLVLRYVDDLELRLDADTNRIEVRSASRVGRSDLGANRKRVEALRAALVEKGVVAATR